MVIDLESSDDEGGNNGRDEVKTGGDSLYSNRARPREDSNWVGTLGGDIVHGTRETTCRAELKGLRGDQGTPEPGLRQKCDRNQDFACLKQHI